MSTSKIVFLFVFLLGVCRLAAAQSRFEEDFDDKIKPWQEIAIQFPAPPKAENLLPFHVSPAATQRFSIDVKSLSVGDDGVIRYTLLTRSPAGAENISYEGIRCLSFEKKVYAFGRKDGTWSRSRRDQWERINDSGPQRQQAALALDYFCANTNISGNAKQIADRIRWKRPLTSRDIRGDGL